MRVADDIQQQVRELGPWFHNLHLPGGIQTAPDHFLGDFPRWKWMEISSHLPTDLSGMTVLDIGCNAGFYTFELARRGATVTAIDLDDHYLAQARWAVRLYELAHQVEFHRMQVYDLARMNRQWDIVLFMGVLYHLRYPLLGLDIVSRATRGTLVFQCLTTPETEVNTDTHGRGMHQRHELLAPGWPRMAFIEHHFQDDPTNWWIPNPAAVEAMLRSSGFEILANPSHEFYLCRKAAEPSCVMTWNRAEFDSATGTGG